jgi:hypothetical protein
MVVQSKDCPNTVTASPNPIEDIGACLHFIYRVVLYMWAFAMGRLPRPRIPAKLLFKMHSYRINSSHKTEGEQFLAAFIKLAAICMQ